jgi:hypothetical protein
MGEKRLTAKDIVEMIDKVGIERLAYWLSQTEPFEILTPLQTYNLIEFVKEHPEEFEDKVIRPEFVYIAFKSMPHHPVIAKYDVVDPECKIVCWEGEQLKYIETPFKVKDFYQYDFFDTAHKNPYFSEYDCIQKIIEYVFGLKEPYSHILITRGELFYITFRPYDITGFIALMYENYLFEKEELSPSEIQFIGRSFRKGGE